MFERNPFIEHSPTFILSVNNLDVYQVYQKHYCKFVRLCDMREKKRQKVFGWMIDLCVHWNSTLHNSDGWLFIP